MATEPDAFFPAEAAKKQAKQLRQLIIDYKQTFAGTRGQRVLEDMKRHVGWNQVEARQGVPMEEVFRRSAGKNLMFHVLSRVEAELTDEDLKPTKRALSNE